MKKKFDLAQFRDQKKGSEQRGETHEETEEEQSDKGKETKAKGLQRTKGSNYFQEEESSPREEAQKSKSIKRTRFREEEESETDEEEDQVGVLPTYKRKSKGNPSSANTPVGIQQEKKSAVSNASIQGAYIDLTDGEGEYQGGITVIDDSSQSSEFLFSETDGRLNSTKSLAKHLAKIRKIGRMKGRYSKDVYRLTDYFMADSREDYKKMEKELKKKLHFENYETYQAAYLKLLVSLSSGEMGDISTNDFGKVRSFNIIGKWLDASRKNGENGVGMDRFKKGMLDFENFLHFQRNNEEINGKILSFANKSYKADPKYTRMFSPVSQIEFYEELEEKYIRKEQKASVLLKQQMRLGNSSKEEESWNKMPIEPSEKKSILTNGDPQRNGMSLSRPFSEEEPHQNGNKLSRASKEKIKGNATKGKKMEELRLEKTLHNFFSKKNNESKEIIKEERPDGEIWSAVENVELMESAMAVFRNQLQEQNFRLNDALSLVEDLGLSMNKRSLDGTSGIFKYKLRSDKRKNSWIELAKREKSLISIPKSYQKESLVFTREFGEIQKQPKLSCATAAQIERDQDQENHQKNEKNSDVIQEGIANWEKLSFPSGDQAKQAHACKEIEMENGENSHALAKRDFSFNEDGVSRKSFLTHGFKQDNFGQATPLCPDRHLFPFENHIENIDHAIENFSKLPNGPTGHSEAFKSLRNLAKRPKPVELSDAGFRNPFIDDLTWLSSLDGSTPSLKKIKTETADSYSVFKKGVYADLNDQKFFLEGLHKETVLPRHQNEKRRKDEIPGFLFFENDLKISKSYKEPREKSQINFTNEMEIIQEESLPGNEVDAVPQEKQIKKRGRKKKVKPQTNSGSQDSSSHSEIRKSWVEIGVPVVNPIGFVEEQLETGITPLEMLEFKSISLDRQALASTVAAGQEPKGKKDKESEKGATGRNQPKEKNKERDGVSSPSIFESDGSNGGMVSPSKDSAKQKKKAGRKKKELKPEVDNIQEVLKLFEQRGKGAGGSNDQEGASFTVIEKEMRAGVEHELRLHPILKQFYSFKKTGGRRSTTGKSEIQDSFAVHHLFTRLNGICQKPPA